MGVSVAPSGQDEVKIVSGRRDELISGVHVCVVSTSE